MMLNTKQKGNLTELQCILAFYELGYKVSIPYGENSRYDFIADIEGKLLRIQCKTCHLVGENQEAIEFKTASTRINSQGNFRNDYHGQIDFFATYWNGKCYIVPIEECGIASKKLRFIPTKSNQIKGVSFAKDYELSTLKERIKN